MYMVAIAWMYVVLMMSVAEATSPAGTLLGAFFTFVLYGLLPMGIVLYILNTPGRRKARRAREAQGPAEGGASTSAEPGPAAGPAASSGQPDAGGHAATGVAREGAGPAAGAPVGKEP